MPNTIAPPEDATERALRDIYDATSTFDEALRAAQTRARMEQLQARLAVAALLLKDLQAQATQQLTHWVRTHKE